MTPERLRLREWLAIEPFTLALSSGFFGFFAHFGFLSALEYNGLFPAAVSGSSAGALAGAIWASGCPLSGLEPNLFNLTTADFWDPAPGFGLLKGERFRQILVQTCPLRRLEECSIPVRISAFDVTRLATDSISTGVISEVVYASCCVPLLFQPIRIGNSLYLDGGIGDRPGLAGTPLDERVLYHHLRSRLDLSDPKADLYKIIAYRPNTVAITIHHIEAVGPGYMNRGRQAFRQARTALLKALDRPIGNRKISI